MTLVAEGIKVFGLTADFGAYYCKNKARGGVCNNNPTSAFQP